MKTTKKPEVLSLDQLETVTGGAIYWYAPKGPRNPRGNHAR